MYHILLRTDIFPLVSCLEPRVEMQPGSPMHKVPANVPGDLSGPVCAHVWSKGECWDVFLYHSQSYFVTQGHHCC